MSTSESSTSSRLEKFSYDDDIVRKFAVATVSWALVATLAGLFLALELVVPSLSFNLPYLTFGRLRPLHTNAAIFAFAGNAIFAGIYYSSQRLLKARLFNDKLGRIHFWGWQAIIVAAAITLPLGITQSKEYAELEWPIDLAIAAVWVVFAINLFGTIAKRREQHIYVAIWFYIATVIAVAILHIFNNLVVPAGLFKSYSIYAGVQDAFMQWWYGHNAVAFFLTTPFLGLMYYFLPKAADRPVYSYRLSILHFWSLVFLYIWAGPHHLHYTALPEWASTLGMLFSVMLWMPSWGGMINGLMTLRGAWNKVAEDPVLKFFVVAITFYGMSTFEGPMLSIKSVNALSHYTDWTIAHVHAGALGWNGFMAFGMVYWLLPRLFQTKIWSPRLVNYHFWLGTLGILFYIVPIYAAGVTQGLMWRAFDETGRLAYPDFIETVVRILPMYWVRVVGGSMYVAGIVCAVLNMVKTWQTRPAVYDVPVQEAPALTPYTGPTPKVEIPAHPTMALIGYRLQYFVRAAWHRVWERHPLKFSIFVTLSVATASLFEILPTFLIRSNVPTIASVKPYTPLELVGRDIYISEGCYNCHSQMIRPIRAETERYGEYSKPGEFIYDHPFQWGSRRIGPDLQREGGKYPHLWHVRHMQNPKSTTEQSIMPAYAWLLSSNLDYSVVQPRIDAMAMLGVPYGDAVLHGEEMARAQAKSISDEIIKQGGPDVADKQILALVAYLQRLGTDINRVEPSNDPATKVASTEAQP
ncbi:MAG TPA: cytochrome-c oxidase, cbb3-type subunit I [Polyangiaceae bacterium]|jgi:cytochrome c oxidase cbb3-type subunit I/II|nr:cytochrome-c oxidase, cbb3-type subunit I [Polyangiaceae bacterium]